MNRFFFFLLHRLQLQKAHRQLSPRPGKVALCGGRRCSSRARASRRAPRLRSPCGSALSWSCARRQLSGGDSNARRARVHASAPGVGFSFGLRPWSAQSQARERRKSQLLWLSAHTHTHARGEVPACLPRPGTLVPIATTKACEHAQCARASARPSTFYARRCRSPSSTA